MLTCVITGGVGVGVSGLVAFSGSVLVAPAPGGPCVEVFGVAAGWGHDSSSDVAQEFGNGDRDYAGVLVLACGFGGGGDSEVGVGQQGQATPSRWAGVDDAIYGSRRT